MGYKCWRKISDWASEHQKILEVAFVFLLGAYFFKWSIVQEYNYAPDEAMRYALPKYLYDHSRFPIGDAPDIRNEIFGFSYAFMPTWLEPLLACLYMHIGAFFFGESEFVLVTSARFVSVIAMAIASFFILRMLDRIVSIPVKWTTTILIVSIPQFAFVASYVNQDSLNLCGASMIACAWVWGIKDGWNIKNSILLSIGIITVALSYYFGYGWILGSVLLFFLSYILRIGNNKNDYKQMLKLALQITCIVLIIVLPFFIRNLVVYDGDLLGRAHMSAAQIKYGQDWIKPENRPSLRAQGYGFSYILRDKQWWMNSFISFVGDFGYLQYPVPKWIWRIYESFFVLYLAGCMGEFIVEFQKKHWKKIILYLFIGAEFALPIFLSLWYSYSTDYGPQGRYVFALIPALTIMIAKGDEFLENHRQFKRIVVVLLILYVSSRAYLNTYIVT